MPSHPRTLPISIDFSRDGAQDKAQSLTALFTQAQESTDSTSRQIAALSNDLPSSDGGRDSPAAAEESHSNSIAPVMTGANTYCLPSSQMHPPTGLFFKQGVQAVCCTFHAQAQAQPTRSEAFARWTLVSVTPVSPHSAVCHLTSTDTTRGTPYTRGRGRTKWHKTWHTTLRSDGMETDYAPTSTWEQWEAGECDLLVGVRRSEAAAGSSLHTQPIGSDVWLSKPKMTLSVPSLVHQDTALSANHPDDLAHAGVLLVLGGAAGLPNAAQVLHHADVTTCFGTGAERVQPLQSPVHLVYACERDDILMTSELSRWCAEVEPSRARLRRLVLAISAPRQGSDGAAAFPQTEAEEAPSLGQLGSLDNVSILHGASPMTAELLQAEMAPLRALGRCRVVVSGPAAFNVAVAEMLEAQCQVDPDAITIVGALATRRSDPEEVN